MLYLITGKLGSGKSLYAVQMAWKYFAEGRRVVANFPIDFSSRKQRHPRNCLEVIPDLPTADDLQNLGRGGENEHSAGLIIIDEGARWLNSRDWNGQDRQKTIDWLLHSRKRGWDVALIIQHHNMLDKQAREGLAEMHVVCRRLDRVKIAGIRLPHIHVATTYYGIHTGGTNAPPKAESAWYRPQEWGQYYDTSAEFADSRACYTILSRWHLVERYKPPMTLRKAAIGVVKLFLLSVLYISGAISGRRYFVTPKGTVKCVY